MLGVDVSERMLARARELTAAERLDNITYELGDAQVHRFVPAGFMPESEEERLLIAPPERNMDVTTWKDDQAAAQQSGAEDPDGASGDPELEAFRRRLEGLL